MPRYLNALGYITKTADDFYYGDGPGQMLFCSPIAADTTIDLAKHRLQIVDQMTSAGLEPTDFLVEQQLRPYLERTQQRYDPRLVCRFLLLWDV